MRNERRQFKLGFLICCLSSFLGASAMARTIETRYVLGNNYNDPGFLGAIRSAVTYVDSGLAGQGGGFDLAFGKANVSVDGQEQEGLLDVFKCPTISGCLAEGSSMSECLAKPELRANQCDLIYEGTAPQLKSDFADNLRANIIFSSMISGLAFGRVTQAIHLLAVGPLFTAQFVYGVFNSTTKAYEVATADTTALNLQPSMNALLDADGNCLIREQNRDEIHDAIEAFENASARRVGVILKGTDDQGLVEYTKTGRDVQIFCEIRLSGSGYDPDADDSLSPEDKKRICH